jgi:hypothetical protein
MIQKSIFYLLCFFCFTIIVVAQENEIKYDFELVKNFEKSTDYFTTDNEGNLYTINADEIMKFNSKGDLEFRFSNKSLGNISHVDARNKLKILLFYKDFSKLLFLDNMLAESSNTILLQDYRLDQASVVCMSFNNGFWVFDQINFNLVRMDQNLRITHETGNLSLLLGNTIKPNFALEAGNYLYINDPLLGILVFDIYGTYYKTIPLLGLSKFQVIDNKFIYFYKDDKFRRFDLLKLSEENILIPPTESPVIGVRTEKNMIYIRTKNQVGIYKFSSNK